MGIPIRRITESTKIKEAVNVNNYSATLDKDVKAFSVDDELVIVPNEFTKENVITILAQDLADSDQIELSEATDIVAGQIKEFGSSPKFIKKNGVKESEVIEEDFNEDSTKQAYVDTIDRRVFMFPSTMSNDAIEEAIAEFIVDEEELSEDEATQEAKQLTDIMYDVYDWED